MTHTPGPFTYEPGPKGDADVDDAAFIIVAPHLLGGRGEVVAAVYEPISEGTPEDNALLFAAAPALLAACKAQHRALDVLLAMLITRDPSFYPSKSEIWPDLVAGNAAIKKAER